MNAVFENYLRFPAPLHMMHAACAGFALTEPAQALPGFKKVPLFRFQSTRVQTRSGVGSMIHLQISLHALFLQ